MWFNQTTLLVFFVFGFLGGVGKAQIQLVPFPYKGAIAAKDSVSLDGNYFYVDSFDSSDASFSNGGLYDSTMARSRGDIYLFASEGIMDIGNAAVAGAIHLDPSGSVEIGSVGTVGDFDWIQNSTGIQDGHLQYDASAIFPSVVPPTDLFDTPVQGVTFSQTNIQTSTNVFISTNYPAGFFSSIVTNTTYFTSTTVPATGSYIGLITTNSSFMTNTAWVTNQVVYPATNTYVGVITTNLVSFNCSVPTMPAEGTYIPGTLINCGTPQKPLYGYSQYQYSYFQITSVSSAISYSYYVIVSYTATSIVSTTNVVFTTYDYVFGDGAYRVFGLAGNILVNGHATILADNVSITGRGGLTIAENGALALYVADSAYIHGNGIINKTGSATNFVYLGLDSNYLIDFAPATACIGCWYAPNADFVVSSRLDFTELSGAIAVGTFRSSGVVRVHFDEAISRVQFFPPQIIKDPESISVAAGSSVSLSVEAMTFSTGTYTWLKDGVEVAFGFITNHQTIDLTFPSVSETNAGDYQLVINNGAGIVTSAVATVRVMTVTPVFQKVYANNRLAGEPVKFSVNVAPFLVGATYRWFKDELPLNDSNVFLGTHSPELSIPVIDSGFYRGNYYVKITSGTNTVISSVGFLEVLAPTIESSPRTQTVVAGGAAAFTVNVSGLEVTNRFWLRTSTWPNWTPDERVSGRFSSTLTISNVNDADNDCYVLMVQGDGFLISTGPSCLTVVDPPQITNQPLAQSVFAGSNLTFTVSATGTAPLNYQWFFDGTPIWGATNSNYTVTNCQPTNQGIYSVGISNVAGYETSSNVLLSVLVPPAVLKSPTDATNDLRTMVTLATQVEGSAPLACRWLKNGKVISDTTNVFGTATATLTIKSATTNDAGLYALTISNFLGSVTSAPAKLTVNTDLSAPSVAITAPTSGQRLFEGVQVTNGLTTMRGTARDNVRVARVIYQLNNGEWQTAVGTNTWSANLPLRPGTNTVVVKSIDAAGKVSAPLLRSFIFVVPSHLNLAINGIGKVTTLTNSLVLDQALLEVDKGYSLKAVPGAGYVFKEWSGDIASSNAIISFLMRSNLSLTATFITNQCLPAAGTYNGLFSESEGVVLEHSGFINLSLKTNGTLSGRISIDGDSFAYSGAFNPVGDARIFIPRLRQGKSSLTINFHLDYANAPDQITGTVGDGGWQTGLLMDRAIVSTNYSGIYTLSISNLDGVAPGYDLIRVATNGVVSSSGVLTDNARFSQSVPISKNGDLPLYAPLYPVKYVTTNSTNSSLLYTNSGYKGLVLGRLKLTNNLIDGEITWINGQTNLAGSPFTNHCVAIGSRFIPPIKAPALSSTNGQVTITCHSLNVSLSNTVVLLTNNVFMVSLPNSNSVRASITATSGQLQGSFLFGGKTRAFNGVVLQHQNCGRAFFLDGTNGGAINLQMFP